MNPQPCAAGHQHQPCQPISVVQGELLPDGSAHGVAHQHEAAQRQSLGPGEDQLAVGGDAIVP
jgi:hypothetical protein